MSDRRLEIEQSRSDAPYIYRIPSLDAGLGNSVSARLVREDAGVAGNISNLTFEYPGIVTKRRGTSKILEDTPGIIRGLYEWEKTSTRETYIIVAIENGDNLDLYFWNEDNSEWSLIIGELSLSEIDMVGFADQLIIANPGELLMSWDGDTVSENLGASKSYLETFFPYSDNDLRFESTAAGITGNYIQIEFVKPTEEQAEVTITTSGAQAEGDPLVITVKPAWNDAVPHKMWLFLDNPIGGTFQVGDPFGYRLLDYNATAQNIEDALKELYGEDKIVSVGPSTDEDKDFIIEFTGMVNSYLRLDSTSLEYEEEADPDPSVGLEQEYIPSQIVSTANDIITKWDVTEAVNDIVSVENITDSDGTGIVDTMTKRAMIEGYDAVSGRFLEIFRGRLILIGDEATPNLLRGSHTGDPTLWNPHARGSNAFELYVGPDDGSRVTGALEFGDGGLLIGKDTSIYGLFGYTRANFIVDVLDSHKGVNSHESMGYIRPYAFFVSHDGVYRYSSGSIPENITLPIQEIFDNEVDLDKLSKTSATVVGRNYIVSLPAIEGDNIVLVYYVDGERWSRWTEPNGSYFSSHRESPRGCLFAKEDSQEVLLYGTLDGRDRDADFPCEITTLELAANSPEIDKYFGEVYFVFRKGEQDYTVNAEVVVDDDYTNTIAMEEVIPSGDKKQVVLRAVIGREGRFITLRISSTGKGMSFGLMSIIYTLRPQGVL